MVSTISPAADGDGRQRGLWDIEAVARRLGVEVRHVRRLVAERRIPYLKWGHLLRFEEEDIEAWLDDKRVPPRPEAQSS